MSTMKYHFRILLALLSFTALSGCFKDLTKKVVMYENDLESGVIPSNIEVLDFQAKKDTSKKIFSFGGSKVLGNFNGNAFFLSLSDLPEHNVMQIEFDLYVHDKWDGDHIRPGSTIPDIWGLQVDGQLYLLTTFSNTTYPQTFPEFYPSKLSNIPKGSAIRTDLPGLCSLASSPNGTSLYRIIRSIKHSSSSAVIRCNDALQPLGSLCEKSWSIDNIKIIGFRN